MQFDFVIIGGGVIGLATAYELSLHGVSVAIIERGAVGRESSWAGAGILAALPSCDYSASVLSLTSFSERLYPQWARELSRSSGIDPEYRVSGMLVLDWHNGDWSAAYHGEIREVRARDIAPALGFDGSALWLPEAAQVRPPRLLTALRKTLEERAVRILENCNAEALRTDAARVIAVKTADGDEIEAANFVVCAGAWSRTLLAGHALALDIEPVRGQILLFKLPPGALTAMVLEDDFYLVPRADGHVLAGSTVERVGFDRSTTLDARAELACRARRLCPLLHEEIDHWAGLRPGSPGNVPVIGRHPALDNLYVNSGHFRYGVTMAPGSARLLAAVALGLPTGIDVGAYRWPDQGEDRMLEG